MNAREAGVGVASTGKACVAGTARRSCSAPSVWMPIRLMRSQALSRPSRQAWQVAARDHRPDRDALARGEPGRAVGPDVLDDRRELVALDARVQLVVADRAHVAVEVVEVGAAEPDRLRPHDDVAGLRRAGLRDVDDLHRRPRARDRGSHAYPLPCRVVIAISRCATLLRAPPSGCMSAGSQVLQQHVL